MRRCSVILFGLVLICSLTSMADQLQWNTRETCERASVALKQAAWIVSYCSLCDDGPAEIWSVKGAIITPTAVDGLYEVVVSGARLGTVSRWISESAPVAASSDWVASGGHSWICAGIDLAYTYVLTEGGALRPLGRILGLPCHVGLELIDLPQEIVQAAFGR